MDLIFQRCLIHADRIAVARCPACAHFFCRECITEHEGKFLCSNCLQRRTAPIETAHRPVEWLNAAIGMLIGLSVAWLFFYLIGRLLILIPANLHPTFSVQRSAFGVRAEIFSLLWFLRTSFSPCK